MCLENKQSQKTHLVSSRLHHRYWITAFSSATSQLLRHWEPARSHWS
jgi:hypothetical protein